MQMTQRLVGMPLTLDHWHPRTAAAAGHGSDVTEHISVGRITRSWIDDIGCLRITALIDADVSESIGGRIRAATSRASRSALHTTRRATPTTAAPATARS